MQYVIWNWFSHYSASIFSYEKQCMIFNLEIFSRIIMRSKALLFIYSDWFTRASVKCCLMVILLQKILELRILMKLLLCFSFWISSCIHKMNWSVNELTDECIRMKLVNTVKLNEREINEFSFKVYIYNMYFVQRRIHLLRSTAIKNIILAERYFICIKPKILNERCGVLMIDIRHD